MLCKTFHIPPSLLSHLLSSFETAKHTIISGLCVFLDMLVSLSAKETMKQTTKATSSLHPFPPVASTNIYSSGKCKLKRECLTMTYIPTRMAKVRRFTIARVDENMKLLKHKCVAGKTINCLNQFHLFSFFQFHL